MKLRSLLKMSLALAMTFVNTSFSLIQANDEQIEKIDLIADIYELESNKYNYESATPIKKNEGVVQISIHGDLNIEKLLQRN